MGWESFPKGSWAGTGWPNSLEIVLDWIIQVKFKSVWWDPNTWPIELQAKLIFYVFSAFLNSKLSDSIPSPDSALVPLIIFIALVNTEILFGVLLTFLFFTFPLRGPWVSSEPQFPHLSNADADTVQGHEERVEVKNQMKATVAWQY